MLNVSLIVGVDRKLFEQELNKVTEKSFKAMGFEAAKPAYEAAIDYFFIHYEDSHRSDSNHNSCLVILDMENKNRFMLGDIKFSDNDFQAYLIKCRKFPTNENIMSLQVAQAFKGLAKNLKFSDIRLFLMNYS